MRGRGYAAAQGPYAVVIGGANMDICGSIRQPAHRGFQPGPGAHLRRWGRAQHRREPGAPGTDTRLLTAVGNDQYGHHHLLEVSQRAGVDVRQVLVLEVNRPPAISACTMAAADELRRQRHGDHRQLPARLAPWRLFSVRPGSGCSTPTSPPTLDWLFERQGSTSSSWTPCRWPRWEDPPWLHRIHTLKPNRTEAEQLCGFTIGGPDTWPMAAGLVPPRRGASGSS